MWDVALSDLSKSGGSWSIFKQKTTGSLVNRILDVFDFTWHVLKLITGAFKTTQLDTADLSEKVQAPPPSLFEYSGVNETHTQTTVNGCDCLDEGQVRWCSPGMGL